MSDYIAALIDNGINTGDLVCQLQDFLHDETEIFICELNEFLEGRKSDIKESEVEVDYEDDGKDDEVVTSATLRLPQRVLREYSPERGNRSTAVVSKPRPACTNFIKKGYCKFGDECRYAHIQRINHSNSMPSRIKLSNLPPGLLNPTEITAVMSKYGNVTGVTVYPEKGEASVQFVRGEEAQKAYNDFVYDEEDGIVIEIESNKEHGRNTGNQVHSPLANASPHPSTSSQDIKLQSLLSLQKRQQSILESNLSVQQNLLNTLQNPALSEVERLKSLEMLKSIQGSVMGIQEMLKKTTELVIEAVRPGQSVRPHYNGKQGYQYQPYQRAQPQRPQKQYPPVNSYKYNATSASSLDLRPTTLKLTPLPASKLTDIRSLQRHFSPYGLIQSLIITDQGQSATIKYQKHGDAVKALENAGKDFDAESVNFSFI